MKIAVGSTSVHKTGAVEAACREIFDEELQVRGFKAASNINEQPMGMDETLLGAENRLKHLVQLAGEIAYDLYVAMEGGMFQIQTSEGLRYMDCGIVIAQDADLRRAIANCAGIELPIAAVAEASERGFRSTTVGSILAEKIGIDGTDVHEALTDTLLDRKSVLAQALRGALGQLLLKSSSLRQFKLRT